MAGGSLTITADIYPQLEDVAQRILCWAAADKGKIQTTSAGSVTAFRIPEEVFAGKGALVLKRGGTDLVSGYVAGTNIVVNAGNGSAMGQNPATCPASTNEPTISTVVSNVGGNRLAITLNYANVALSGTVDIFWGDGTSTLGAAESGAANHTYPNDGVYTITISDVTVPTDTASLTIHVP